MNFAKRLYELQLIDSEIQSYRDMLAQLNLKIGESETVRVAKAELDAMKKQVMEIGQKRRDLEWSTEDLQKNITNLNVKLYGGKVGNPKELMSLEQEKENFTNKLRQQEDELLDLMNAEEETQKRIKIQSEQVARAEVEWQKEQQTLIQERGEAENHLLELEKKRQLFTSSIDPQSYTLYESIRLKKGQVVVKVEQGRCQGCRITLPVNEWQRAKSGTVVQCSSCGKILYLE
jgi:predicted  nucleic acid-binding Zn-ribbon protein